MHKASKKNKHIIYLIILIGFFFRFFHFYINRGLWGDEVSLANNIVKYSFTELFRPTLDNTQSAPFGFLVVVKLFTLLTDSNAEMVLRLFPLICGLLSILVFYKLLQQTVGPSGVLIGTFIIAVAPTAIYHSVEIKQYATEQLVALCLLLAGVYFRSRINTWNMTVFGWIGAIGVWFSYSSIFVLTGIGAVWLLFLFKEGSWRKYFVTGICFFMWITSFGFAYFLLIKPNENVTKFISTWNNHFVPLPISFNSIYWYPKTLLMLFENPVGLNANWLQLFMPVNFNYYLISFSYCGFLLGLIGFIYLYRSQKFIFLLLFVPVVITILASFLQKYPFYERFLYFLAPTVWIWVSAGAEFLLTRPKTYKPLAFSLIILMLFFPLTSTTIQAINLKSFGGEKYSEFRDAIDFVENRIKPGDKIYFGWNAIRFYQYYSNIKGLNWQPVSGSHIGGRVHDLESFKAEVAKEIFDQFKEQSRVWIILQTRAYGSYVDESGNYVSLGYPEAVVFESVIGSKGKIIQSYTGYPVKAMLVDFLKEE